MNNIQLLFINYDTDITVDPIIEEFLLRNSLKQSKNIYDNAQNVHDSTINMSISESLNNIMSDKLTASGHQMMNEIINDPILTQSCKESLVEYSKASDVHSVLNVTFKEVLMFVWNIIRSIQIKNQNKSDEIKRVLNVEMKDSLCKCFTGRLSRLVNCLSGFDERIQIKIPDNNQIANIIILIKDKYNDDLEKPLTETAKSDIINKIKEEVIKELTERKYEQHIIDQWTEYID
jgi:hypothetical protein